MDIIREWGELILLIVLLLINSGKWAQKTQATPESLARDVERLEKDLKRDYLRKDIGDLRHQDLERRITTLEGHISGV